MPQQHNNCLHLAIHNPLGYVELSLSLVSMYRLLLFYMYMYLLPQLVVWLVP